MRESLLRMEFFETYYYANIVHNVLNDPMPYLRNISNWHEERDIELFLQPFPRWSVLHDFIEYIIKSLMCEDLEKSELEMLKNDPCHTLWIDQALAYHDIETQGFRTWLKKEGINLSDATDDVVGDYHDELWLTGELGTLLTQLTHELFYLLFSNRTLLSRLNGYISRIVSEITREDLELEEQEWLQRDGVPARVHIPEWAKKAVFFRDRGMCAICNTDLTGIVFINKTEHYDHVIPLAEGGINDVTNLQLLCSACNLKKGRQIISTSSRYQSWYPMEHDD